MHVNSYLKAFLAYIVCKFFSMCMYIICIFCYGIVCICAHMHVHLCVHSQLYIYCCMYVYVGVFYVYVHETVCII